MDSDCVFCRIVRGELKAKVIAENDKILVIEDINPKAKIHYLIIPKKHIENINFIKEEDYPLVVEMAKMAKKLGEQLDSHSFTLVSNNGKEAGQSVFHLHWHFIYGRTFGF